jgi:hypothetical protein
VPGDVIAHKASIRIDEDVTPAEYDLLLGLYSPQTMERLHLTKDSGDDFIRLQSLTVSQ